MKQQFIMWMIGYPMNSEKQEALKQVSYFTAPSCLMQDHDGQCSTRTALATKLGEQTATRTTWDLV